MVDPLSYFSFHPVLHDWCDKRLWLYTIMSVMLHIKEPLLLIGKIVVDVVAAAGFLLCRSVVLYHMSDAI